MSTSHEGCDSLLTDFLDEAGDLLDKLNERLLVLDEWAAELGSESARCDDQLMTEMFRAAHSIKGLSGMLGLTNINRLTHKIENVFDAARKDELVLRSHVVQSVFQGVDQLTSLLDSLRHSGHDNLDCSGSIAGLQLVLEEAGCARGTTNQADAERALQAALTQAQATASAAPAGPVCPAAPAVPSHDLLAGIVDDQEIPPRYLAIFIDEAGLSLDELTETLLNAEAHADRTALETLLCTAHRIKGSAASIGLNRCAKLAHLMEDSLQSLRESGQTLSSELADALLQCADALRTFVAELRAGSVVDCDFSTKASALAQARERPHASLPATASPPSQSVLQKSSPPEAPSPVAAPPLPEPTAASCELNQPRWLGISRFQCGDGPVLAGCIRFEPGLPLAGLKGQLLAAKLSQLGELRHCEPPEASLENLDTLERLVFVLSGDLSPEGVATRLRVAGVQEVEIVSLPESTVARSESVGQREPPSEVRNELPSAERGNPAADAPATGTQAKKSPAAGEGSKAADKPSETLRVDIERLDELMNLAGQLVISRARFSQLDQKLREAQPSKNTRNAATSFAAFVERLLVDCDAAEHGAGRLDLEQVRTHARRLQADLAVMRGELENLSRLRNHLLEFGEAVHQLGRVSEGIQKSVMDTRMVPVGPLFTRFRRVVRDISRGNGKQIELVIKGEKTELDKRMIDELGDPLIHMVRNSADHGIESPEQRVAAGKPRQGTITLDAFHRGNAIVISVRDDGKGLDREKILAKALERKLIAPAEAENLAPHQIHQLVWLPGFSTAEKVTDISGRGMGMDIVRSKIEELSGTVEIFSTPGEGTEFVIRLPLTLAILPSLLATIGGDVFAMPIESVVEIVSHRECDTRTVHGVRTSDIRGRVLSVIDLAECFSWNGTPRREAAGTDRTLVVIASDRREVGLLVDSVLGEDDIVIKSISENYRNVQGIAGASILGDGRVALILDVPAVIEMTTRGKAAVC